MGTFRGVAGALVTASGALVLASGAAAQGPEPVLEVTPAAVVAGNDVTVSGSCPGGGAGLVQGIGADADAPGDEFPSAVSGDLDVPAGPSFSAMFTIPDEVTSGQWRFSLLCLGSPGSPSSAPRLVEVTAGTPVPLTLTPSPDPARPGEPLRVTGTGCLVTGRPSQHAFVKLAGQRDGAPISVEQAGTPAADGSFEVTLPVPDTFPSARSLLAVDCVDTSGPGVRYRRSHAEGIDVAATTTTTTTATTAAPPTSTGRTLPRTGASTPTPVLSVGGFALVATGIALVLAAQRRRRLG